MQWFIYFLYYMYVQTAQPVLSTKVQASSMTANTILIICQLQGLIYRSLRHVTRMWYCWWECDMCVTLTPRKPLQLLRLLWQYLLTALDRLWPVNLLIFTLFLELVIMNVNVMKGHTEFWGSPLVLYCTVCNTHIQVGTSISIHYALISSVSFSVQHPIDLAWNHTGNYYSRTCNISHTRWRRNMPKPRCQKLLDKKEHVKPHDKYSIFSVKMQKKIKYKKDKNCCNYVHYINLYALPRIVSC